MSTIDTQIRDFFLGYAIFGMFMCIVTNKFILRQLGTGGENKFREFYLAIYWVAMPVFWPVSLLVMFAEYIIDRSDQSRGSINNIQQEEPYHHDYTWASIKYNVANKTSEVAVCFMFILLYTTYRTS